MAGGVALNCVANSVLWRETPFRDVWVQPAAGDAGTALGAALHVAHELGDPVAPMGTAALGRGFDDAELERWLAVADVGYERPPDIAAGLRSSMWSISRTFAASSMRRSISSRGTFAFFRPNAMFSRTVMCG